MDSEAKRIAKANVTDALRYVSQEARALKMIGFFQYHRMPKSSRILEALEQLELAYEKVQMIEMTEVREESSES